MQLINPDAVLRCISHVRGCNTAIIASRVSFELCVTAGRIKQKPHVVETSDQYALLGCRSNKVTAGLRFCITEVGMLNIEDVVEKHAA